MRFANFLLLFAAACVAVASSASASSNPCSYSITEPNSTYRISNASCGSFNITFHQSAYNSSVVCANTAFGSSSTLTFEEGSVARIYNCSLDNAKMTMLNGSHARIIGASNVSV
ncbi:MAG: hypothetical protein KGH69_05525, partial [Candidatus Micrarchaeota archaeon]|nr:hypothetical protein [Candidatus Micrarchaeota archaeon]